MNALFYAHSWLRYLVLLAALVALIALGYGFATGRSVRRARNLGTTFAALLDLQIVLGIALMMGGVYPDAVTGHLMLMIAAAVVMHGAFVVGQQLDNDRHELGARFIGIVLALVLIVLGIMAIGQTVLGHAATGLPTAL
jgi:heme A synthase